jgi:hypothetical protein
LYAFAVPPPACCISYRSQISWLDNLINVIVLRKYQSMIIPDEFRQIIKKIYPLVFVNVIGSELTDLFLSTSAC